jgi:hypothetical protein
MRIALIISFLVVFLAPASAYAGCSIRDVAGRWLLQTVEYEACIATISSTGRVTGTCGTGSLAVSAGCAISGKLNGIRVRGRTENVAGTNRKPNLFNGLWGSYMGVIGFREP